MAKRLILIKNNNNNSFNGDSHLVQLQNTSFDDFPIIE